MPLLFHSRKTQYLRAHAFPLVDAAGRISLIFDLGVLISVFFLCCPCGRVHRQEPVFIRVPAIGLDLFSGIGELNRVNVSLRQEANISQ